MWIAFPKEKSAGHPSPDDDCATARVAETRIHLRRNPRRATVHLERLNILERNVIHAEHGRTHAIDPEVRRAIAAAHGAAHTKVGTPVSVRDDARSRNAAHQITHA